MSVEATVVLEFNGGGPDSSEFLHHIEIDTILNDNLTTFPLSYQPIISAHFSKNIRVVSVVPLEGDIYPYGNAVRVMNSERLFSSRDEENPDVFKLPVVPDSFSVSFQGREGAYTTNNLQGGMISIESNTTLAPFLLKMESAYTTNLYKFIPPSISVEDGETYNIYIVFYLEIIEA